MSSTYTEYKSNTQVFIDWIYNAATHITKSSKKLPRTFKGLLQRTKLITDSCESIEHLPSNLFSSINSILKAGKVAIDLRSKIHFYFLTQSVDTSDHEKAISNEGHAYCIEVLTICYELLKKWRNNNQTVSTSTKEEADNSQQQIPISNRYSALSEMFEDLAIHEQGGTAEQQASIPSFSAKEDSQYYNNPTFSDRTIEDIDRAFGEMNIAAISLLFDVITGLKEVKKAFERVKQKEINILTAVGVTIAAFHSMQTFYNQFQLEYPQLQSIQELYRLWMIHNMKSRTRKSKRLTVSTLDLLLDHDTIYTCLQQLGRFFEEKPFPEQKRGDLLIRRSLLSNQFHEHDSPLLHSFDHIKYFICCKLFCLHNTYFSTTYHLFTKQSSENKDFICCTSSYWQAFQPYFDTGTITVPLVFLLHAWLLSIYALQDCEQLIYTRSCYLLRSYGRRIEKSWEVLRHHSFFESTWNSHQVPHVDMLLDAIHSYTLFDRTILYQNLLLQGFLLFDQLNHFTQFTRTLCSGYLQEYFYSISHLYDVLQREGYCQGEDANLLLQQIKDIFQSYCFLKGETITADPQNFYMSRFFLAQDISATAILHIKTSQNPLDAGKDMPKRIFANRSFPLAEELSFIYRCFQKKDYSSITNQSSSSSSSNATMSYQCFLQTFAQTLETDLFHSRFACIDWVQCLLACSEFFYGLSCMFCQQSYCIPKTIEEVLTRKTSEVVNDAARRMLLWEGMCISLKYFSPVSQPQSAKVSSKSSKSAAIIPTDTSEEEALSSNSMSERIAKFFTNYFNTLFCESHQKDIYLIPISCHVDMEETFGSIPYWQCIQSDQIPNNVAIFQQLINKLEEHWNDCKGLLDVERIPRQVSRQKELVREIRDEGKTHPLIFLCQDATKPLISSLLAFSFCGRLAEEDLFEWILAMRGHVHDTITVTSNVTSNSASFSTSTPSIDSDQCIASLPSFTVDHSLLYRMNRIAKPPTHVTTKIVSTTLYTPLHVACMQNVLWTIESLCLYTNGHALCVQSRLEGNSALHTAAQVGQEAMLKLLAFPSIPDCTNWYGKTVVDIMGTTCPPKIQRRLAALNNLYYEKTETSTTPSSSLQPLTTAVSTTTMEPRKNSAKQMKAQKKNQDKAMKEVEGQLLALLTIEHREEQLRRMSSSSRSVSIQEGKEKKSQKAKKEKKP